MIALPATLDPPFGGGVQAFGPDGTLALAGRLLAYRRNTPGAKSEESIVVMNIDTGETLFEVPLPAANSTFGLLPDGRLVIASTPGCTAIVASTAEPSPRSLGVPACAVRAVAASGALAGGGALVTAPGAGKDRVLAWTSLASPALHLLADMGEEGRLEDTDATTDGTSVLYARPGCWAPSIYAALLSDPGTPPLPPRTCSVRAASGAATLSGDSLSLRVRCPLGCEGELTATLGICRALRRPVRVPEEEPESFEAAPAGVATVGLGEEAALAAHRLARRAPRGARLYLRLRLSVTSALNRFSSGSRETKSTLLVPIRQVRAPRGRHS